MLDKLPTELLTALYGYLSHSDQKSLRLTCVKCYEASFAVSLIKNDVLHINKRILKPACKSVVLSLEETKRKYFNLVITDLTFCDYYWAIEKFSSSLKTITFVGCSISIMELAGFFFALKNLEELRFNACALFAENIETVMQHTRLKYLEITDTSYLTDKTLSKFFALCPNLERLSIQATSLNIHIGIYNFNYKPTMDVLDNPSDIVFTVQFFKALIKSRSANIRTLNVANTFINNESLTEILQTPFLKLECLNIANCRELRRDQLNMGEWQPYITDLNISNCRLVTNNLLEHICQKMPYIHTLNLSNNDGFNDEGLNNLKLLNLLELDMSNCSNISSQYMREILTSKKEKSNLKILRMSRSNINDHDIIHILCTLNLTELDVSACTYLTDIFLKTLFLSQSSLKKLKLIATDITDAGLTGIDKNKLRLPNINLDKYENVDIFSQEIQDDIVKESLFYYRICDLNNSTYNIERLSNLIKLDISYCPHVTDFLFTMPLRLPNLRSLSLCGIKNITSKALLILVYSCPTLEDLDLTGTYVKDVGIFILVKKLKRLKHLCLRNCLKISNTSLYYIKQHCKSLITLNVFGCYHLTHEMINEIKDIPSVFMVIGISSQRPSCGFCVPNAPPLPLHL